MTITSRTTLGIIAVLGTIAVAVTQGQGVPADGAKPNVIVSLGQPNAWTMEQAHYLLERNRAHDMGIAAQDLGPLDANEIVGYRLEAIKSLLTAQAQHDATTGTKNAANASQFNSDLARYNALVAKRDQLLDQQASLAGELAASQYQLALLQAQPTPDAVAVKTQQADVTRLMSLKAATDAQIGSLNTLTSTAPSLSLTSTLPGADTTASVIGANSAFTTMLSNVPPGLNNSKLQASIKLDNYINLQYEIVAKQLTLLRDQAGPGRRVVFLELPQSIYLTHKFKPYPDVAAFLGGHIVQTWWTVDAVLVAQRASREQENARLLLLGPGRSKTGSTNDADSDGDDQPRRPPIAREFAGIVTAMEPLTVKEDQKASRNALLLFSAGTKGDLLPTDDDRDSDAIDKWILWNYRLVKPIPPAPAAIAAQAGVEWEKRPAFALDLIPRRTALNVADAHTSSHAYGFAGLVGFLTGFGARARYERQRDEYSQFAQQEAYAAAFGKGEEQFGWTFGPLPGTKRLDPGLRTTYAVLVVPSNTRYIRVRGVGCGFRRRTVPVNPLTAESRSEECGAPVTYDVEIPQNDDDFWLRRVYYRPQLAGQRTTVELGGRFGTQVGVLINGTPLQRVVSIGQPMLEQTAFTLPANAGDAGVSGVFELVAQKQLLLSFSMPKTFVGTPRIAIVTPTREAVINGFRVDIKNSNSAVQQNARLDDQTSAAMFVQPTSATRVSAAYDTEGGSVVVAQLFGQGFEAAKEHLSILLNGEPLKQVPKERSLGDGEYRVLNAGVIQARFKRDIKSFPHWQFDVIDHGPIQTMDVTIKADDEGPPVLETDPAKRCSGKLTTHKDKSVSADLKITGKFFQSGAAPEFTNKSATIVSKALASSKSWTVSVSAEKMTALEAAVLQLKGLDAPMVSLSTCTWEGK